MRPAGDGEASKRQVFAEYPEQCCGGPKESDLLLGGTHRPQCLKAFPEELFVCLPASRGVGKSDIGQIGPDDEGQEDGCWHAKEHPAEKANLRSLWKEFGEGAEKNH